MILGLVKELTILPNFNQTISKPAILMGTMIFQGMGHIWGAENSSGWTWACFHAAGDVYLSVVTVHVGNSNLLVQLQNISYIIIIINDISMHI